MMKNGNGKYIYLSEPKLKTLKFITKYIEKHNFSPTFAEISKALKWSRARSGKIVSELYDLGFISKGINAHRKIEMTTDYKIFDNYKDKVIYEDSFSRNSLLGPIDSLFSREQSERNARKRLGVSISNDIIIRLVQWAEFSY